MQSENMTRQCRRVVQWVVGENSTGYGVTPRALQKCLQKGYLEKKADTETGELKITAKGQRELQHWKATK